MDYREYWVGVSGTVSSIKERGDIKMEAYCMKCKAKSEMNEVKAIVMKNGKPASTGICAKCGTKMFKIGKS